MQNDNSNSNNNNNEARAKENNMNNNIQNIATTYIEAAREAQAYLDTRDRAHLVAHSDLFREADARFEDLIAADSSQYDCPLRDLRHAVANNEFGMAGARYLAIVK